MVGLCSIVYELLISTTSSYLLGDSITQFSITIGTYMAAMGLGSYLVRYLSGGALQLFVVTELALGVVGALCVPILYGYFAEVGYGGFQAVMLGLVAVIGTLTGLEIPLLTRLLGPHFAGETALSNVLTLDYVGALAATLLFPFVLLPFVGVFQSSIAFGMVNVAVACYTARRFRDELPGASRYVLLGSTLLVLLALLFGLSAKLLAGWQDRLFRDPVVYAQTTPYQTLTMTRAGDDLRLYIDRVIQWSAEDEYRYHESLVHPAMLSVAAPRRVLVLGGGEGLAVREILRHSEVDSVTVVDIDPAIFGLARTHRQLLAVNGRSLLDPRVRAVAEDAFVFLSRGTGTYDVIVADLPDPTNESVARLYSVEFFTLCARHLAPGGAFVTQATGPSHTNDAFWCIGAGVRAGVAEAVPYHSYVPSFGDWGFWLAGGRSSLRAPDFPTRYFTPAQFALDRRLPKDLWVGEGTAASTLNRPILLDLYLADLRRGEVQVW